jgi:hypothetical protein
VLLVRIFVSHNIASKASSYYCEPTFTTRAVLHGVTDRKPQSSPAPPARKGAPAALISPEAEPRAIRMTRHMNRTRTMEYVVGTRRGIGERTGTERWRRDIGRVSERVGNAGRWRLGLRDALGRGAVVVIADGHLPVQTPPSPLPKPAKPMPTLPSLTGLFATVPCALTPSTTLSRCVSTTTPPTIISPRVACSVSKLKMRSSSHTFSKRPSRAWTKTCIRSRRASGDSVEVEMTMKYSVA